MLEITMLGGQLGAGVDFELKKAIERCALQKDYAVRTECMMNAVAAAGTKVITALGTLKWDFIHASKALEGVHWWYWDSRWESVRAGDMLLSAEVGCVPEWQGHCARSRVAPAIAWLYDEEGNLLKAVAIPPSDLIADNFKPGDEEWWWYDDQKVRDPKDGSIKNLKGALSGSGKYVPGLYKVGNPNFPYHLPAFIPPKPKASAQFFRESNLPAYTTEPSKIYESSIYESPIAERKPWYKKPTTVVAAAGVGAIGALALYKWRVK